MSQIIELKAKPNDEELCHKLRTWLENAIPGDKFEYFFGRHVAGHGVARIAYKAFEKGRVTLYQRKMGINYSYLAECVANYSWR